MEYSFKASETFWKAFYALSPAQKESVRAAWKIFKSDPFDSRLGTHRINRLSALRRRPVYAVVVEGDLRVLFEIRSGGEVFTTDLGSHDLYK